MNITLTQFGNEIGSNVYLPYAIGCIVAYCKSKLPDYNFKMLYIKDDIEKVVKDIGNPDILAMSTYIWNHEYNIKIAKKIKEKYPKTHIIFGGHHIDGHDNNIFEKYPYIDMIVNGEGERAFYEIISPNHDLANCTLNKNGVAYIVENKAKEININEIPSPYLHGIFDDIIKESYKFTASLESNRGCPYGCSYCDWGNNKVENKKVRKFDEERVFKEIEWMAKNGIEFVFGCDANFGLFKERDMKIIDKFIEMKKEYGYPKKFRVCYAKNSNEIIFEMNKKLDKYDLSKGATLSFQSMNKNTTEAIGRINLPIDEFNKYIRMYSAEGIPVYTEMIIGLPEETYDSFKHGFDLLLDNHQHGNIVVYYCQVYPNSKLNDKNYKEKYKIKTSDIILYPTHTVVDNNQIFEREEIIVSTRTLSKEDWIKTCMFSCVVQTFHCLGITQLIAIHMRYKYNINYSQFYQDLLDYFYEDNGSLIINKYINMVENIFKNVASGKDGFKFILNDLYWPIEEGGFLYLVDLIELTYVDIMDFIYEKYRVQDEIKDIVIFNKFMLNSYKDNSYNKATRYKVQEAFFEYFYKGEYDLKKGQDIMFIPETKKYNSFNDYAINVVWYGRKGGSTLKDFKGE